MDTEVLDKLYLEWSQFTSARNQREIHALEVLRSVRFTEKRPLGKALKKAVRDIITDLEC